MKSKWDWQWYRPRARVRRLPSGKFSWHVVDALDVIYAQATRPVPRLRIARAEAAKALQEVQLQLS